jgi:DNA transposition AAA+ family ATPase
MDTRHKIVKLIESGLTQKQIADRVGTSQPTISRFLRGLHSDIKASIADAVTTLYEDVFSKAA